MTSSCNAIKRIRLEILDCFHMAGLKFVWTHILQRKTNIVFSIGSEIDELLGSNWVCSMCPLLLKQSNRSPKVVTLFLLLTLVATLYNCFKCTIQFKIKWSYARIQYNIAIRSHLMISKMCEISFLLPNLVAFSCCTVNIHLEKLLLRCDTKRAIWWNLYNKRISIFCIKHMSTIFRTL